MKSELKRPTATRFEGLTGPQSVVEHAEATPSVEGAYSEQGSWRYFPPENSLFIEWTYTIDLDREAFTVDSLAHFRLSNIPEDWIEYLGHDETYRRTLDENMDPIYLASNIIPSPPEINNHLIKLYMDSSPTIIDPPRSPDRTTQLLVMRLQESLPRDLANPLTLFSNEWLPEDTQMQQLAYTLVKLSTWEALRFFHRSLPNRRKDYIDDPPSLAQCLLLDVEFPREPNYYVPVGDGKVLISLATHLEIADILKMAVAKVITMSKDNTTTTACILSLKHVVIVDVVKTPTSVKTTHTEPLELFGETSLGRKSLIAILSPHNTRRDKTVMPNTNLPLEIIEVIFRYLTMTPGAIKTLPHFAAACKLFSAIVHDRIIRVSSDRILLNYPTWLSGCLYGLDDDGWEGLYHFGNERHPVLWSNTKRIKHCTVLVDGANFRIGELQLVPVDVDKVVGIVDEKPIEPSPPVAPTIEVTTPLS